MREARLEDRSRRPWATQPFRDALGVGLVGAPAGVIQTPLAPLAVELVRRGHAVTAICLDPAIRSPARYREGGIEFSYLPMRPRARHRAFDLGESEIGLIEQELARSAPQFVHAHWGYEFAEAAVRSRLPHLVTLHDSPVQVALHYRNLYRASRAAMALRALHRVKALAVVSPAMAPWARLHGYSRKVHLAPNGIDIPALVRRSAETRLRTPKVVVVGGPSRVKNVGAAIRAFRLVRGQRPAAELHLFGDGLGPEFAAGEPQTTGHGAVPHERLMRFLEDEATVLLQPSLHETFGVILAEAMARGVPAIAGRRSGGPAFVLGDALASQLVDVRAAGAMAEAMLRLIGDPAHYAIIADLGRARVEAAFTAARMADAYEAIYAEILHPKAAR